MRIIIVVCVVVGLFAACFVAGFMAGMARCVYVAGERAGIRLFHLRGTLAARAMCKAWLAEAAKS